MKRMIPTLLCTIIALVAAGLTACSSENISDETESITEITTETTAVDSLELWSRRDTNRIYGVMYRSASPKQMPAVILSHSSSLTHAAMADYARKIAEHGFAAYCFDFCGGSPSSQSDGSSDQMTVFTEVEDLRAVVETVKAEAYVDSTRVFLMGSSQGGLVSALLADETPEAFSGMVLLYPAFNIPDLVRTFSSLANGQTGSWGGLSGQLPMGQDYLSTLKDFDVWSHIGRFAHPVCILHGTQDIIVPMSYSEKAADLYPDAQLHPVEGANHGFNKANLGSLGSLLGGQADYDGIVLPIVLEFLKTHSL